MNYFNQRKLDVDGCFAKSLDYLFSAQYISGNKTSSYKMMELTIFGVIKPHAFFTKTNINSCNDKKSRNDEIVIRNDKAYIFMKPAHKRISCIFPAYILWLVGYD